MELLRDMEWTNRDGMKYRLLTIGNDKCIVEYGFDVWHMQIGTMPKEYIIKCFELGIFKTINF